MGVKGGFRGWKGRDFRRKWAGQLIKGQKGLIKGSRELIRGSNELIKGKGVN